MSPVLKKMKTTISVILSATVLMLSVMCGFIVNAQNATDYSKQYIEPIFSDTNVTAGPAAKAVGKTSMTNFTADVDYTVKAEQSAGITFDMPMYYYNDGTKPIKIVGGTGVNQYIKNEDGYIKIGSSTASQQAVITENLVESVTDFDLKYRALMTWSTTQIRFGVADGSFRFRLILNGGNYISHNKTYGIALYEYVNGKSVLLQSSENSTSGSDMRVVLQGQNFKVYQDGNVIIDYEVTTGPITAGGICLTGYREAISYDYISIDSIDEDIESDNFYEVSLGETVALGRYINGQYTEIAKSETALVADTQYNFKVVRDGDSVRVTADDNEILKTEIAYPYTQDGVSLWNGFVGVTASVSGDCFDKIDIYDSANISFARGFANLIPFNDIVEDDFTIESQGSWNYSGDAFLKDGKYSVVSDSEFTVTAPSQTNGWIQIGNILKENLSDGYIKFDISSTKTPYHEERLTFAGYTLRFDTEASVAQVPTVTGPSGAVTVSDKYLSVGSDLHTIEILKKGNTVSVYYYPVGSERNLLFADNNCTSANFNLKLWKRYGIMSINNFTVYDAIPTGNMENLHLLDESLYQECADGIGGIPMGTTVREVCANLIHGETAYVTRNGVALDDAEKVLTDDVIKFSNLDLTLNIGTLCDLNGDGITDSTDVSLAQTALNATTLTAALCGADVDQNGYVDQSDIDTLDAIVKGTADTRYLKRSIVGEALFENFKMLGRQYYESGKGVNFEMNAASITVAGYMKGDVTVTIDSDICKEDKGDALVVYIDGYRHADNFDDFVQLKKGVATYTVAKNLSEGYHTVEIKKSNQPMDSAFYLRAVGMTGTPDFAPYSERRIEIIGDSIAAGSAQYMDIKSATGGGVTMIEMGYASRAARLLGADYYAVANGGWAFYKRYPNTIERIYDLASDVRDPEVAYDFSNADTDLVYINLGTNDNSTLYSEYQAQGAAFDFDKAKAEWKAGAKALLDKVRKNNPDAKIIWGHGAMGYGFADNNGQTTGDWLKEAVEEYNQNDGKVAFLKLRATQNGLGGHPDAVGNTYLAKEVAVFIAEFMGWDYEEPVLPDYEYGDIIKNYTFDDGTKQGIYTNWYNGTYLAGNNKIGIDWNANISSVSCGLADDLLDTYEMTLDWSHRKNSGKNTEIVVLRSKNESLDNAIYLKTLGTNAANGGDNVKLYFSKDGVHTEVASTNVDDLYTCDKKLWVKMGVNRLEVTLWNATDSMPESPTFGVPLKNSPIPCGNIFLRSSNSHNHYGNILIKYGVTVELSGDLDRSKVLDTGDLVMMKKHLLGLENADMDYFAIDVNRDSAENILDLVRLKKDIAK